MDILAGGGGWGGGRCRYETLKTKIRNISESDYNTFLIGRYISTLTHYSFKHWICKVEGFFL